MVHGRGGLDSPNRLSGDYRGLVEQVIREEAEATAAIADNNEVMGMVTIWRRTTESYARQKSGATREAMLKAAGYGLGSPKSVKDTKDLLLTVKPLMQLNKEHFLSAGAKPTVVDFPVNTLARLERSVEQVAKEKADVVVVRGQMAATFQELASMFRAIDLAVGTAINEALLEGDVQARQRAETLETALGAALNEAKVQAHAKAQGQDVPGTLLAPTPTPEPAKD